MTAIIPLGMHRSGTSLVASILGALGVHIGDNLGKPAASNPWGHYEDVDFVLMNERLLDAAGGHWAKIPPAQAIAQAAFDNESALRGLVKTKRSGAPGDLWGWKDPRTCLTAGCYHQILDNPHYIVVRRDRDAVIDSLTRRDGESRWDLMYEMYWTRIKRFLLAAKSPVIDVRFEDLTHPIAGPRAVRKIARFIGVDDEARIVKAIKQIRFRDHWGFGSIGIGTPYYKAQYEFFRWWSWILVGGLEPGDQLLNTPNVRCELPIPLAHNAIIKEFLMHSTRDTLCMVEDDHVGPQDIIHKMRYKPENQQFDIVCASYVNRRGPTTAVGFTFDPAGPNEYGEWDCLLDPWKVTETGTQEYDGAALGLVLIRRWVLEAFMGDGHPDETFWCDWRGRNSQDVQFYANMRGVGARTGVDRDNAVGHISKRTYTMEDFFKLRHKAEMKRKQEGILKVQHWAESKQKQACEANKMEVIANG